MKRPGTQCESTTALMLPGLMPPSAILLVDGRWSVRMPSTFPCRCRRNVGLMAAAQPGSLPDLSWLYFALVQLPIYLTPLLLRRTMGFPQQKNTITERKPLRPEE